MALLFLHPVERAGLQHGSAGHWRRLSWLGRRRTPVWRGQFAFFVCVVHRKALTFKSNVWCEIIFFTFQITSVINLALDKYFPVDAGVRIIAEPGRFYVASAYTLVVNIIAKKVIIDDDTASDGNHLWQNATYGGRICHWTLSSVPTSRWCFLCRRRRRGHRQDPDVLRQWWRLRLLQLHPLWPRPLFAHSAQGGSKWKSSFAVS